VYSRTERVRVSLAPLRRNQKSVTSYMYYILDKSHNIEVLLRIAPLRRAMMNSVNPDLVDGEMKTALPVSAKCLKKKEKVLADDNMETALQLSAKCLEKVATKGVS
jgi:hypothetical protein